MAHAISNENLSPAEKKYSELIHQGDDFFRIEIFRNAKALYTEALECGIHTQEVKEKLSECNRLLAYERKVFTILGIVFGAIAIVTYLLLTF